MNHVSRETSMRSKPNVIKVKDHLVSGETFKVVYDEALAYASTQFPNGINLDAYYPKASYASHQQKPKGVKGRLYVFAQHIMLRYKYSILKRYCSGTDLLDIGGGIGVFAHYMNIKGFDTTLIEPSATAREIAVNKGIESFQSLEDLPALKKYDILSLWHVLEHIEALNETLQKFYKLLKNNGLIVVAVPNLKSFDAQHYGPFWAALDVPRHLWHFTPKGLNQLLEENGFTLVSTYPLWFDAIYISLISETYSKNKFGVLRGIFIGFYSNFRAFFNGDYSSKIFVFKKKN